MKTFKRDESGRIDFEASGFKPVNDSKPLLHKWHYGQWPEAPWKRRSAWNRFWKRVQIWASRRGYTRLHQFTRRLVRWI